MVSISMATESARLAQIPEEGAQVTDEQVRDLQGGEVAAVVEIRSVDDRGRVFTQTAMNNSCPAWLLILQPQYC